MRLSQAADYALRAVLYLARQGEGTIVDAQTICEEESVPKRFLLKIFRELAQTKIIESYRGKNGGYALGIDPAKITLRDVIEAVDGPIVVNRCLIDPAECNKINGNSCRTCTIHEALFDVQQTIVNKLEEYTFADLLNS
ncbi:transcriptional regulator [Orenia metallireducens]|uniref:Transcriptional regulator n=1 Tax=Orenia metallireducens TaxID=1413210 RepID=A0A1C0AD12_9FIRM|nr:Rrf2 family transcriptional regulator [Orenia metallireducens]OCL28538.1 transcriptional regulator [Orenia metallireducens]